MEFRLFSLPVVMCVLGPVLSLLGKLITEQQTYEYNPLFAIAQERNEK